MPDLPIWLAYASPPGECFICGVPDVTLATSFSPPALDGIAICDGCLALWLECQTGYKIGRQLAAWRAMSNWSEVRYAEKVQRRAEKEGARASRSPSR